VSQSGGASHHYIGRLTVGSLDPNAGARGTSLLPARDMWSCGPGKVDGVGKKTGRLRLSFVVAEKWGGAFNRGRVSQTGAKSAGSCSGMTSFSKGQVGWGNGESTEE